MKKRSFIPYEELSEAIQEGKLKEKLEEFDFDSVGKAYVESFEKRKSNN